MSNLAGIGNRAATPARRSGRLPAAVGRTRAARVDDRHDQPDRCQRRGAADPTPPTPSARRLRRDRRPRPRRRSARHRFLGQRGRHRPRRPRAPADPAPGRAGRDRAGRHGHAALGRRQGEPVLPARVQPRSRHRLQRLGRRRAGQHADPRPWTGVRRPELPDPRDRRHRPLSQGSVPRRGRRLLDRRLRLDGAGALAAEGDARRHRRQRRLRTPALRGQLHARATTAICWSRSRASTRTDPGSAATTTKAPRARCATPRATRRAAGRSPRWATTRTGSPPIRSRGERSSRV